VANCLGPFLLQPGVPFGAGWALDAWIFFYLQSGMGPQILSDKRTNQTTGMGYGTRFNYDFVRRAKEQPGAGDYNQSVACGKQPLSMKKTLPLYSFGSSNRDQAGKVYMSREHEKSQKGASSPGPITAAAVCTMHV
jgi:hypothetical protein